MHLTDGVVLFSTAFRASFARCLSSIFEIKVSILVN